MFLKSLTVKGFKSFADKTSLEFEPGVTVVVGPNGSGKSNLVDAVAWVLGAQGPRTLRGGKMDDVIFAGTPDRPALGRAEVSLAIDNSSGLLPIEFSEVTITRTLFRTGESEYALNGAPCRLLDLTDLLSDTGIGRQQHVIVGQGQLDSVLTARPDDRRAIIEEAAGILKFRKRREKAERRLESTEGTLLRLNDLLREVRRGLAPLERQADAARRHGGLVDELVAIRLHLVGHELAGLQLRAERLADRRGELGTREGDIGNRLRTLDLAVLESERALTAAGEDHLADALARAEALRERIRGLDALLTEKQRGVERELTAAADGGAVETLVADAAAARRELDRVDAEAVALIGRADDVEAAEAASSSHRSAARAGKARAERELYAAETRWRELAGEAERWRARGEALALALDDERDAAATRALDGLPGVVGPLVDHLEVEPGAEAAVGAALGEALRAVVVEAGAPARRALEQLKADDAEALLIVLYRAGVDTVSVPIPPRTRPLTDLVRSRRPGVEAALVRVLRTVVLADGDWRVALELSLAHPELTVVTAAGDRFGGPSPWRAGGTRPAGVTLAMVDEARSRAEGAEARAVAAEAAVVEARREVACAATDADARDDAVLALRRDLDVHAAAVEERRAVLRRRLDDVEARLARHPDAQAEAERQRAVLAARSETYGRLLEVIRSRVGTLDALHERLRARRRARAEAATAAGGRLDELRTERATFERELAEVRERAQRTEIDEAETRLRLESALERIRTEFDREPTAALDAPAPVVPEGTTLAGRARDLERELKLMGPVNPLALEEFEALQERHEFLRGQLEDVKGSRRELQRVIRAVDREIVSVFERAFGDVQRHFQDLFITLFPGGSGRISLTDPDDLLHTGIEIEARPSGKNTRRLSLLSGGERSLTALAFLFSVFRARPSPFYLLDEVEAALDDVNLHRFLDLVNEFRSEAQLVVVSHQKRTMEAADCLYGVSMPPGGSSRVVSQRLRDVEDLPVA